MTVTDRDAARLALAAGVGISTVRRVLCGGPARELTREHVLAHAERLGLTERRTPAPETPENDPESEAP